MEDIILEVQNLSKSYKTVQAVASVSFEVHRGEILAIMGPNGAGKSTTLECILGTRTYDNGAVSLLGMDPVSQRREVFTRVGVQFQSSSWQPAIRVREICESTACLYDPVPDWEPMLISYGLGDRAKVAAESLSGGERQRLAILLACIHAPEVVFLDELTTGLDPIARRETWKMIEEMRDSSKSIILVSHYMDEVDKLADRGMIMNHGKVIAIGTLQEIRDKYRTANLEEAYVKAVTEAEEVPA